MVRKLLTLTALKIALLALLLWPATIANAQVTGSNDPLVHKVRVKGATLTVRFSSLPEPAARKAMLDWTQRSANAVALYYGHFPLRSARIFINPFSGRGVRGGTAYGGTKPRIVISAGTDSSARDFANDWRMVHEMIHLAFPMIDQRHSWMTEGLAVYVESIARLQASDLDEATVWKGFIDGMEKGLPRAGDRGLDNTPTWGRTYWGGAIFCLVADLEIRKQTDGKKTLQDALRAVIKAGGDHRTYWSLTKALAAGDSATGTTVLVDLYEAWRATPVDPELPKLWKRLGIEDKGRSVSFDDTADLAVTRRAIGKPATH